MLAYWGGLTADQIAHRSDVPLGTAKSRIRLGLAKLRERVRVRWRRRPGRRPARVGGAHTGAVPGTVATHRTRLFDNLDRPSRPRRTMRRRTGDPCRGAPIAPAGANRRLMPP